MKVSLVYIQYKARTSLNEENSTIFTPNDIIQSTIDVYSVVRNSLSQKIQMMTRPE